MARRLVWPITVVVAACLVWRCSALSEPTVEPSPPAPVEEPRAALEPAAPADPIATSEDHREATAVAPGPATVPEKKGALPAQAEATLWIDVVSRETGAPVADVWIWIFGPGLSGSGSGVSALDGGPGAYPRTGADGRARFRMPPGKYALELRWEGLHSRTEVDVPALAASEERTQRIEIPTGADQRFLGRVLDECTGAPVARAEVLLFHGDSAGSSWYVYQRSNVIAEIARTTTDTEGRFELATQSSQRFEMVRVRAQGYAAGYTCVEPGHEDQSTEIVLRVRPSATLVARVEQAGQPIAKIRVGLALGERWICGGETGVDGRCSFEDLPAGVEITMSLTRPEPETPRAAEEEEEEEFPWDEPPFPRQRLVQDAGPVVLTPGERKELVLELGVLCTVRGVVHAIQGEPVPGLQLRLIRDSELGLPSGERPSEPFAVRSIPAQFPDLISTDDEGVFLIPDLPSATWWLGPFDLEDRFAAPAQRIEIPEGLTHAEVELVVLDRKAKLELPSPR